MEFDQAPMGHRKPQTEGELRQMVMTDRKSNRMRTSMAQVLGITGLQAEPA
jgi:hypothetical protein